MLKIHRNWYKVLLVLIVGLSSSHTNAQSEARIQKSLAHHYQKEKYEKCEKIAYKYLEQNSNSKIAYYYLSKIAFQNFKELESESNSAKWDYLKGASDYASKLGADSLSLQKEISKALLNSPKDRYIAISQTKTEADSHSNTNIVTQENYSRDNNLISSDGSKLPISSSDSLRDEIVLLASKLVGTPYKYAGTTPKSGFDCSGFVMYVYQQFNIKLPHSSQLQSELEAEVITLDEAKPGDIIFFGKRNGKSWSTQHSGIIYGFENGKPKVIHSSSSRGVVIDGNNASWNSYWEQRVLFVKRLPALNN